VRAFSESCISVIQPLYRSWTVMTATPSSLWMLSNSLCLLHASGINLLAPATSAPNMGPCRRLSGSPEGADLITTTNIKPLTKIYITLSCRHRLSSGQHSQDTLVSTIVLDHSYTNKTQWSSKHKSRYKHEELQIIPCFWVMVETKVFIYE